MKIGFGALLLGFYKDGKLQFSGKVGTGFDDDELKNLHEKLTSIEQNKAEFKNNSIDNIFQRLAQKSDPWKEMYRHAVTLEKARNKLDLLTKQQY